jgi:hypothetical protein
MNANRIIGTNIVNVPDEQANESRLRGWNK